VSVKAATTAGKPQQRLANWLTLSDDNPLVPYLYLLPHAIFFLVFVVYPIFFGLWVSVHRYDPFTNAGPFVGLEFYRNIFDPTTSQYDFFWPVLRNTVFFVVVSVPLLITVSLGLALQLEQPIFGSTLFRAIFFMPGILSVSVMGILWKWMFENQSGLINVILDQYLHISPIAFITTEGLAWIPIIVGTVWWTIGFNMTLYLAALNNVPQSYYEAAELDGANWWHKFRFIVWPLLTPTTLLILVTTVIGSFQVFGQPRTITGGGPTHTTESMIMYITGEAFNNFNFSQAVALAFVFGLAMMVFTVINFRITARDIGTGRK
jgi:multiple sugar transport system permease protein